MFPDTYSIKIRNFKCFGDEFSGFDRIKDVNVIIGRNNSGKSALVDLIDICITNGSHYSQRLHRRSNEDFQLMVTPVFRQEEIEAVFSRNRSGGEINGNHWEFGKQFIGRKASIRIGSAWNFEYDSGLDIDAEVIDSKPSWLFDLARCTQWPFLGFEHIRVSAERNVSQEKRTAVSEPAPDGKGVTNLIRAFINQDNLPRKAVENDLLAALNTIYQGDNQFSRISCREDEEGVWEIFLTELGKGEVRLSQSGSSLKSVFIILSFLKLVPHLKSVPWEKRVFTIEEPENNLHPALLRRLLDYLADQRTTLKFLLFLTTHSPVGIDWASRRSDSQIVHVRHNSGAATAATSTGYKTNRAILDDLDIKASDLLQANGIIWIEGPSDRIYLRKWIDLMSDSQLKEGIHYSMAIYGGRLLAHFESNPDNRNGLISILALNRNAAVVIDSDRHLGRQATKKLKAVKPRLHINQTKSRIRTEVQEHGGFVWITEGREIENYVPNSVFARVTQKQSFTANIYDDIPEHPLIKKKFKSNKIDIANAVIDEIRLSDVTGHLDLPDRLAELINHIKRWNNII